MVQGILFDFNGTMFFDEEFQERSWREYLAAKIGRPVSDEEFQTQIHGRNAETSLAYFLNRGDLTRKEIEQLEEEKEIIYRAMCLESEAFRLADGLEDFLDGLKRRGMPMTIATASGLNNVRFFFEHLHLDLWFSLDRVVYNDGTLPGKPAPDLFLKAAERIGVDITHCAVFEDTRSGIQAALRAGACERVGVASMLGKDELLKLGATRVIDNYVNIRI